MKTIGIDIGGTKIAVGMVDQQGRIVSQSSFPTHPQRGFADALSRIMDAVEKLTTEHDQSHGPLCGIGIGCTGPIDPIRGTIHNPHILPTWNDCNLVAPLRERFGVPVRMENDADAAAYGEFRFGADAGAGSDPIVMLTFGTGIGFAAIVHGQVYRGLSGSHPEFGHIPTPIDESLQEACAAPCYCGIRSCFESLASGTAIDTAGQLGGFKDSRAVFKAACSGDATAKKIIDRALNATSSAIWTIAHSFVPQKIIFGGGVMEDHFDLFAFAARQSILNATMIPGKQVRIVKASFGANAGVVGAAALTIA